MNLIEGLREEISRGKELLEAYTEIGPVGTFAKTAITHILKNAEESMANGDTVEMLRAYEELKGCD